MPQQAHFCLWTISLAFPPEASAPCHPITCIHHDHAWHPSCLLFSSLFCPVLFPFFIASFPPDLSFPWHLPSLRSCWIYFVHKTTQHFIHAVFRITCEDQWMRGEGPRRCNASDEAGCSHPPPPSENSLREATVPCTASWWFMILQHEQTETGQRTVLRVAAKTFSSVFVM